MKQAQDEQVIKKMAGLLRSGAQMLAETCPIHGVPLFKLKSGEIICPACGRGVLFAREGEETRVAGNVILSKLENAVLLKIQLLTKMLEGENDPYKINEYAKSLTSLLEVLDKARKLTSK
ncbi:MAG: hypothetical protein DRJ66_04730 [Thermoprotei archaeon]|nr:MAG: hypothetical protein DRJ66_04730 [Thermoprotei archaeon]RLF19520.1 MAG: hypothetical protein DRZ82_05460 [Thermoprotei archaeon]